MLLLLERDPHGQRLCDLLHHFRRQEQRLTDSLQSLQEEAERRDRAASLHQLGLAPAASSLAHSIELQIECDLVATDLVHVRMAIAGTSEELAVHDQRRVRRSWLAQETPA
jgi:hypothetical protein